MAEGLQRAKTASCPGGFTVDAKSQEGRHFHLSEAEARVFCYACGAFSGALMLGFREYSRMWSVRFHAFHSILLTAAWGAVWTALRAAEAAAPWFLGLVARETRLLLDLSFVMAWLFLLFAAYSGGREIISVHLHALAVRLARKAEPDRPRR